MMAFGLSFWRQFGYFFFDLLSRVKSVSCLKSYKNFLKRKNSLNLLRSLPFWLNNWGTWDKSLGFFSRVKISTNLRTDGGEKRCFCFRPSKTREQRGEQQVAVTCESQVIRSGSGWWVFKEVQREEMDPCEHVWIEEEGEEVWRWVEPKAANERERGQCDVSKRRVGDCEKKLVSLQQQQ